MRLNMEAFHCERHKRFHQDCPKCRREYEQWRERHEQARKDRDPVSRQHEQIHDVGECE